MVYLKVIPKNHPNGRFCVGNHRSKNVSEKFRGASAPLAPPGSAYGRDQLNAKYGAVPKHEKKLCEIYNDLVSYFCSL